MWIKIDHSLPQKPEVYIIAQRLGISRAEVVGHLVSFWLWTDQMSADGTMLGNRQIVDSLTTENFANTLIDVGWIDFLDNGEKLEVVNFERHNGTSAKRRATNAQKVAEHRKRKKLQEETKPKPKKVTDEVLNNNRIDNKRINYNSISDMWNAKNTPKVERLTAKRKNAIKILLKEFTEEDCKLVFDKVPTIPYLIGQNEHGWIANFDYVIRPDKFVKILEGGWESKDTLKTKNTFDEWNQ
jgi:hypothetical protein